MPLLDLIDLDAGTNHGTVSNKDLLSDLGISILELHDHDVSSIVIHTSGSSGAHALAEGKTYNSAGYKRLAPGIYNLYPTSTENVYTVRELDAELRV